LTFVQSARRANQQNLSSPFAKNIPLNPSGKSALSLATSRRGKGRFAIVTNAGWDAVDAAASARQVCSQGGIAVSEQQARRTNGAVSGFAKISSEGYQARRSLLAKTGCVRQNRVVPTPVAGVKLPVAASIRPDRSSHQAGSDGDKTNSSPGRARHKP
jgi:hypothetical protein